MKMKLSTSIKPLESTNTDHLDEQNGPLKLKLWKSGKISNDNLPDINLWRVRNGLYDLGKFVSKHPGGTHWIENTKGMDITDFYESYHINQSKTDKVLEKYKVGEIDSERCTLYKFDSDGFFKTLQGRALKVLGSRYNKKHAGLMFIHWVLAISSVASFMMAVYFKSWALMLYAAISQAAAMGGAHNYLHQKNSLAQYVFELSAANIHAFRVGHTISHHTYPNTVWDMEMTFFGPALSLFSDKQSNPSSSKSFFTYQFLILIGMPIQAIFPMMASNFFSTAVLIKILQVSVCYVISGSMQG